MGSITSTLSLIRLQKYSLFQKYNALSATYIIVSLVFDIRNSNLPGNEG